MAFLEGTKVCITFGLEGEAVAEVVETYGPPEGRHILVRLSPEVSGDLVAEPVLFSLPESAVREALPAA